MKGRSGRKSKSDRLTIRKRNVHLNTRCTYEDCPFQSANTTRLRRHIQSHDEDVQKQPATSLPPTALPTSEIPTKCEAYLLPASSDLPRSPVIQPVVTNSTELTNEVVNYFTGILRNCQQEINYYRSESLAESIYTRIEPAIRINLVTVLSEVVRNALETRMVFTEEEEAQLIQTFMGDIARLAYSYINGDRSQEQNETKPSSVTGQEAPEGQSSNNPNIKVEGFGPG